MPSQNISDHFISNGSNLNVTMSDFLVWAYSDTSDPLIRSTAAEYIVSLALGITSQTKRRFRADFKSNHFLFYNGFRLYVRSASYVQSYDPDYPQNISFSILHGFHLDTKPDAYIFCVFKGMNQDDSPLNLDLWDFYVVNFLSAITCRTKTITLQTLLDSRPLLSNYHNLNKIIHNIIGF